MQRFLQKLNQPIIILLMRHDEVIWYDDNYLMIRILFTTPTVSFQFVTFHWLS